MSPVSSLILKIRWGVPSWIMAIRVQKELAASEVALGVGGLDGSVSVWLSTAPSAASSFEGREVIATICMSMAEFLKNTHWTYMWSSVPPEPSTAVALDNRGGGILGPTMRATRGFAPKNSVDCVPRRLESSLKFRGRQLYRTWYASGGRVHPLFKRCAIDAQMDWLRYPGLGFVPVTTGCKPITPGDVHVPGEGVPPAQGR